MTLFFVGDCFWGFVFAVVVETGHAPSLPDRTGMERDGTGMEQGQGRGVAWCGG